MNWGVASAMGSLLMALTLGLFFFAARFFSDDDTSRDRRHQPESDRVDPTLSVDLDDRPRDCRFNDHDLRVSPRASGDFIFVSFTPTTYLAFPPKGFYLRWYEEFFRNSDWISSAWLSFRVAALTMVCASAKIGLSAPSVLSARGCPVTADPCDVPGAADCAGHPHRGTRE